MTALNCLGTGTSLVMTEGLLRNGSQRALTHAPVPKVKPIAELVMEDFMLTARDMCAPGVQRGLLSLWHTPAPCSELKGSKREQNATGLWRKQERLVGPWLLEQHLQTKQSSGSSLSEYRGHNVIPVQTCPSSLTHSREMSAHLPAQHSPAQQSQAFPGFTHSQGSRNQALLIPWLYSLPCHAVSTKWEVLCLFFPPSSAARPWISRALSVSVSSPLLTDTKQDKCCRVMSVQEFQSGFGQVGRAAPGVTHHHLQILLQQDFELGFWCLNWSPSPTNLRLSEVFYKVFSCMITSSASYLRR